jgi:hypothetical protein
MKTNCSNRSIIQLLSGILFLFVTMTGCVSVSDLLWHIPVLLIISCACIYFSMRSRHPIFIFTAILIGSSILLLVLMAVEPVHEMIGVQVSNHVLYFLLQFIPYFLYTGIFSVIINFLRKKNIPLIPENTLGASALATVPVFIMHIGSLLSGGCIECPLNNNFVLLFGWVLSILEKMHS